jgi:glutamate--cysteine ligase
MMKQTATVQANIDYADERDAMRKLRVGMGIAPVVNALFANSPVSDGDLNGYLSFRGYIWTDTDRARCGLLPFAFRDDAGFADYVAWALDVPLYFLLRRGRYVESVTGMPFRHFLEHGAGGERATLDDWQLHLTTLFPEVRLKSYIEFRSADSQPPERLLALPALVKGLLYEPDCLQASYDLVKRWRFDEVADLYRDALREGLAARLRGISGLEYARELYAIAVEGLRRHGALGPDGVDERVYLEPLAGQLENGGSPAHAIIDNWTGEWEGRIERLIAHTEYRI